jgi:hypothetical protein
MAMPAWLGVVGLRQLPCLINYNTQSVPYGDTTALGRLLQYRRQKRTSTVVHGTGSRAAVAPSDVPYAPVSHTNVGCGKSQNTCVVTADTKLALCLGCARLASSQLVCLRNPHRVPIGRCRCP